MCIPRRPWHLSREEIAEPVLISFYDCPSARLRHVRGGTRRLQPGVCFAGYLLLINLFFVFPSLASLLAPPAYSPICFAEQLGVTYLVLPPLIITNLSSERPFETVMPISEGAHRLRPADFTQTSISAAFSARHKCCALCPRV